VVVSRGRTRLDGQAADVQLIAVRVASVAVVKPTNVTAVTVRRRLKVYACDVVTTYDYDTTRYEN